MSIGLWILAGLMMSLLGSLHCAAMCGPIFLASASRFSVAKEYLVANLLHHAGKTFSYILLGSLMGVIGKLISIVIMQKWLLIISGSLLILFQILNTKPVFKAFKINLILNRLQQLKLNNSFTLGVINGLIPCGLSYSAAISAIATGNPLYGALFMLSFGIGTIPSLNLIAFSRWLFKFKVNKKLMQWKSVPVFFIGVLFILKGLDLGIPFISPKLHPEKLKAPVDCCSKP